MKIMKDRKGPDYKGEPNLKQVKASKTAVLSMLNLSRRDNPFDYDLIVANHQQFLHMMETHKTAGTNGSSVFSKYIYALHHEVFHSYEDYILWKHRIRIDMILPSPLVKPPGARTRHDDCVLIGLTDDFPKKKHFNIWFKDY
jgi:hypothetical protein